MEVPGNGGKGHGKSPYLKKATTPVGYAQNLAACKEELKDVKRQLEISKETNQELEDKNQWLQETHQVLQETNKKLEELQICQNCNKRKKTTSVTCQHVFCLTCAKKLAEEHEKCPICKIRIRGYTELCIGRYIKPTGANGDDAWELMKTNSPLYYDEDSDDMKCPECEDDCECHQCECGKSWVAY